jgi:type VI secretion system protein ImpA
MGTTRLACGLIVQSTSGGDDMASQSLFSPETWASFVAPIAADSLVGPDWRQQDEPGQAAQQAFHALRSLRLSAQVGAADSQKAWHDLARRSEEYLLMRAKDFDVALWLCEACTATRGFAGLRDGLDLLVRLMEAFPGRLHPDPDPDETPAATLRNLRDLVNRGGRALGSLRPMILSCALSDDGAKPPATYEAVLRARDITIPSESLALTHQAIEVKLRNSSARYREDLCDDLDDAVHHWARLEQAIIAYGSDDALLLAKTGAELGELRDFVFGVLGVASRAVARAATEAVDEPSSASPDAAKPPPDAITSRDAAFEQLLEIAAFFRGTEPHSPIAPSIEEVVRRGRLPFIELIAELIPDEKARQQFYMNAGLRWSSGAAEPT